MGLFAKAYIDAGKPGACLDHVRQQSSKKKVMKK